MVGKRYRCVTFSCKALSRNLKPPIVSHKFWFNNDVNHNVADLFFLRGKWDAVLIFRRNLTIIRRNVFTAARAMKIAIVHDIFVHNNVLFSLAAWAICLFIVKDGYTVDCQTSLPPESGNLVIAVYTLAFIFAGDFDHLSINHCGSAICSVAPLSWLCSPGRAQILSIKFVLFRPLTHVERSSFRNIRCTVGAITALSSFSRTWYLAAPHLFTTLLPAVISKFWPWHCPVIFIQNVSPSSPSPAWALWEFVVQLHWSTSMI